MCIKKYRYLAILLIIALVYSGESFAISSGDSSMPKAPSGTAPAPQYLPGEILVKFKENTDPQSALQQADIVPDRMERVYPIAPAAEKFRKDYKLEKSAKGWYSFLGKNYKEISQIPDNEAFSEAYKTMPEAERGLYRNYKITVPQGVSVEEAIAKLKANPNVEYAEPNYIRKIQIVPNDPYYSSAGSWGQPYDDLWGLKKIQCAQAWDISQGEGVIVAVVDTGVDYNHPDLAGNIWVNKKEIPGNGIDDDGNGFVDDVNGWNFCVNNNDPMDDCGHGTHCSGTIAAVGNNNLGVIGVAPKATIMPVKALDAGGGGSDAALAAAVKYAADNGANIISNSWGGEGDSQVLTDAFHYANSKGCVCIAAAGNSNADVSGFTPADIDTVIAVAATNPNDQRCSFSNYGDKVDVSAPGGDSDTNDGTNAWGRNILSLRSNNKGHPTDMYGDGICVVGSTYYRSRGTSMACPHVAGLAALIKSKFPADTAAFVRGRIIAGADTIDTQNPGFEKKLGSGRINAARSLSIKASPLFNITSISTDHLYPGRPTSISVNVANGWEDALGVSGTLSTTTPNVSIQNGSFLFGDILSGGEVSNSAGPFIISLDQSMQFGTTLNFNLTLSCSDGFTAVIPFTVKVTYFENAGAAAGLPLVSEMPLFAAIGDYNNDDLADILLISTAPSPLLELYKNCGDGSFANATAETKINWGSYPSAPIFLDINNDGYEDLFIGSMDPYVYGTKIFLNGKDGTFSDVTGPAMLQTNCFSAVAVDYDNNGFVDILGAYSRFFLLRNNADNTFTDTVNGTGFPTAASNLYNGQIVSFDYDNDGDQDILVTSVDGGTFLYRNNGDGTFTDVTAQSGIDTSRGGSSGVAVGDYNNDGNIDIFFTNLKAWTNSINNNVLYRNNGDGTFTDVTQAAGNPGFGTSGTYYGTDFFDYDNDGNLDLYLTNAINYCTITTNTLYHNNGDGTFTYVSDLAFPESVSPGYAAACIGDYNNDGALDIYAPTSRVIGKGALLKNLVGNQNNWIKLKLIGTASNRDAYGARIYVRAGGKTQMREIHTSAVQAQPVHFGLARIAMIDEIEVHWPSGAVQTLHNVNVNQTMPITETPSSRPSIISLTPSAAKPGEVTVINGRGFGPSQGDGYVLFCNNLRPVVTSWADTKITCTVPANAVSGNIYVFTGSGKSNGVYFGILCLPAAPTNLSSTTISAQEIRLNWTDNANNEDGFKIERSIPGSGLFTQVGTSMSGDNYYSETGLQPNTAYYYRVCAYNRDGNSEYSNVTAARTSELPPQSPATGLTAKAISQTQIILSWSYNGASTDWFDIYRGKTASFVSASWAGSISGGTSWMDQGLKGGTKYYYWVRVSNTGGAGPLSNMVSETPPTSSPQPPSNLTVNTISPAQIDIAWLDNSDNEADFSIERAGDISGPFTEITSLPANTITFSDKNVDASKIVYYRIRAQNCLGNSAYSNIASSTSSSVPPNAPSNLVIIGRSSSSVALKWQDNSGNETGFKIERGTNASGPFTEIAVATINATGYMDNNIVTTVTYYYRVRAANSSGNSDYSNIAVAATAPPNAPTGIAASIISASQVDINWQDNSTDESSFVIERSFTGMDYSPLAAVSSNVTTYSDTTVTMGNVYYYRVKAVNIAGSSGYAATYARMSTPAVPYGLGGFIYSRTQIYLNWSDQSDNETGFKIERRTSPTELFVQIAQVAANTNTYTDSGLMQNTTYYYRMRATNALGDSVYSNEFSVKLLVAPAAPAILQASIVSGGVKIDWTDNSDNEDGFKIYRCYNNGITRTSYTEIGSVAANIATFTDPGIQKGTLYYYTVRAFNSAGLSAQSNEISISIPRNRPPIFDPIDDKSVIVNSLLTFTVSATDPDGDTLVYSAPIIPVGAGFDPATRTFSWTPGFTQVGTYQIVFQVSDGSVTVSRSVTVTVTKPNGPPVLNAIGPKTVDENHALTFTVSASDPDNDQLTYSVPSLPIGASFDPATRTFSWTPTYEQSGVYNVTFEVSDGKLTSAETITITVNDVDRPPVMDPIGNKIVNENALLTFTISATDPDMGGGGPIIIPIGPIIPLLRAASGANGQMLTYSSVGLPQGATFDPNTRTFTWIPTYYQAGTYQLTFIVSDGTLAVSQTIVITVNNVNGPPVIDPIGNKTVNRLELLKFRVKAVDPDNDRIVYYVLNKPLGSAFNQTTGEFSWRPTIRQAGDFTATFIAKDSNGNQSSPQIITITVPNHAPILNPIGNKTMQYNHLMQFKITAHDPDKIDNPHLKFYSGNLPSGAYLSQTGTFVWTPAKRQVGTYTLRFFVKDPPGLTDSQTITVTIK
jgi:subtilisin family serine protease/fibronectin type 3 domain-containing protein